MSSSRPSMNSRPLRVEVAEVAARQQPVDLLLAATTGVAVEAGTTADEDAPDDVRSDLRAAVIEDAHDAAWRRAAGRRRCRLQVGRLRRSWPARPRSSRRCCRGSARTGAASPSPEAHRAPSRSTRCIAARRCRSGRAPRRSRARMRCSITGTTIRPSARCSATAASVASGSNRSRSTAVDDIPRATPMLERPQAWNSGAAMTTVSRARIGTVSSSGVSVSMPRTAPRDAPFGRPVVPEVRMTWRPTWRVGLSGANDRCSPSRRQLAGRHRDARFGAGHDVGERVVVEHGVDAFVGDDVGELRPGEAGVQVDDVGTELGGGDHAQHEATPVAGQDADRRAWPDRAVAKASRDPVGGPPTGRRTTAARRRR